MDSTYFPGLDGYNRPVAQANSPTASAKYFRTPQLSLGRYGYCVCSGSIPGENRARLVAAFLSARGTGRDIEALFEITLCYRCACWGGNWDADCMACSGKVRCENACPAKQPLC